MKTIWIASLFAAASFACCGSLVGSEQQDPTGTWTWVRELEGEKVRTILKLEMKDGKIAGTYRRLDQNLAITHARMTQNTLSFEIDGKWSEQPIHGKFQGKVTKDLIHGTVEITIPDGSITLDWDARRGIDPRDLAGTWKLKLLTPDGNTIEPVLKLTWKGAELKGIYTSPLGTHPAEELKLEGTELSWKVQGERDGQKFQGTYKGKLEGTALKGTLSYNFDGSTGSLEFSGDREATPSDKKQPEGKPKGSASLPSRRAIVCLKNREQTVVIYAAAGRTPAFTVRSNGGTIVAEEISVAELQRRFPRIYETYRTQYAGAWADR